MTEHYQPQSIQPAQSDFQVIANLLRQRVTRRSGLSMVDFAGTVSVTAGPRKGELLKLENAPYSRRPLELMDPSSIMQLVVLMWASQSMKSINGQIVSAYYIQEVPSEVLYAMADLAGMRKTMNRRIVPMLECIGVEFVTSTETKNSRRTGDTTFSKEGNGFNFDGITANSSAALASETKRLFIADELGNWKVEIGNQGNPFYQGWARLKAWLDEKKCLVPSTPGDEGSCMVEHLYLTGTQEHWDVPCPLCGTHQTLEVRNKDGYGLVWDVKKGRIKEKSIVYVCLKCARSFTEKNKFAIQQDGYWEQPPDVEPISRYVASFGLHSINSMFESWLEIASAYEKGLEDPIAKKYYDNHVAGKPHRQTGAKINTLEVIKNNRGDYQQGTVPDGVCYLILGADVQRGSDKWQEFSEIELQDVIVKTLAADKKNEENTAWDMKFPRIEFEVLGIGPAYRSWSIDYQVIYGKTDLAFAGAFEKFYQWGESLIHKNGKFGYKREKDGRLFNINMLFIDSGHATSTVYDFTQRWRFTFPCKGDREVVIAKKDAHLHNSNFVPWKRSKVHNGMVDLYTLSTKFYTTQLYQRLKVKRSTDDVQWAAFQDFPKQYPAKYFEMLTVEELKKDGGYDARGKPNESGACRRYAFTAADVYLSQQVEIHRARAKDEKKYTDLQIENTINSRWVIEYMAKLAKIDPRFLITKGK
ncbi:MAG: hypothetical protein GWP06_00240 [Actinobacteria bacterium]|nr:hypothetical protein [Actinomycetota bacterium]